MNLAVSECVFNDLLQDAKTCFPTQNVCAECTTKAKVQLLGYSRTSVTTSVVLSSTARMIDTFIQMKTDQ